MNKYNKLFTSLSFAKGIILKNRIVMSPMTTWASNEDFTISDEEVEYYRRSVNGVGLVITGCTHVTANGIGFTHEFAGYNDTFLPSLKKLASATKSGGAPAILQIFHAGNKAIPSLIPDGEVVSASAISSGPILLSDKENFPLELTENEILEIIKAFGETTRRAIEAGFDGVEIHGAHGFLLQNFISPFFNKRNDQWGGSLENRLRLSVEVLREVRNVVSKCADRPFLIGYRISPEEIPQQTYGLQDTFILMDKLIEENIDYLHFSLLDAVNQKPIDSEFSDEPISVVLNNYVNDRVPVLVAGGITTPAIADQVLEYGISIFAIGRALVINPDWVELVKRGEEERIDTSLKLATVKDKKIPAKLMTIFAALKGWVPMEH
ncbi:NADH-dependent flavin oxidoreductase [Sphingobacterium faecium NBRC 15299]|uniref:NADH-dependent flavin oxidoreductase n=1 Tax=Sphingobacterium faecium TaxID=34087 RepID=UPI000D39C223|nr:NADH-dependent flavin oxidoreductase [Sphingobacterium faecium]PTX11757.1 2,4-dienoyl-CoA reductase-like NADH-dependent reductase (Old Yellow Enzyme family) [Sphingobacterium faecium]GEM63458.1 NADH-dependent flavin oxidoreductase [Sphingobacterium faecium NBRC 15299]